MATDLVTSALINLYELYQGERELMKFADQEKEKLASKLSAIVSVLQDAEEKQLKGTSRGLDDWLKKMENAVYLLEDILDDCSTEAIRNLYEGDRCCSYLLSLLHPHKIMFRRDISERMKAMVEKLNLIDQEKTQFSLVPPVHVPVVDQGEMNTNHHGTERLTSSVITEDLVCGREKEKEELVRLLLEDCTHHEENPMVCSIVAMGGLGKTMLAKLVYNDKRVQDHFHETIWICVSENFEMKALIKEIIGSSQSDNDNLDQLQKKFQEKLGGKRYLLVLDDVWNEDQEKWIHMRGLLSCGLKGSSIIVTTRQDKVAIIMETPRIQPYRLKPLSDDACWLIFRKRAFRLSVSKETENLVTIGKQIVEKCRGSPLVAKVLGGLLSFQSNEGHWCSLRDSELWDISDGKDSIFGPLKLSYINLPLEYRRCFCYCAVFPKDYKIKKENIIELWMANSLIPSKRMMDMEDTGDQIITELYWRSLIEDVEKDESDLIHDLAKYVVGDDIFVVEGEISKDLETRSILHVSVNKTDRAFPVKGLRSYINLEYRSESFPHNLSEHTSLRALDLRWTMGWSWESSPICHPEYLKHLRYLNLSYTDIDELPKFVCSLWNLQTLILDGCKYLREVPQGLGRLKTLRHLKLKGCSSLSSIPGSICELTSLRTLNHVIVNEGENNSGFPLSALGRLKNVKGKMKICFLPTVKEVNDAQKANLMENSDLNHLTLKWKHISDNDQDQVQILEALRPPKLKYLRICGYNGASFPHWMRNDIASFKYLKKLELDSLENLIYLTEVERDSYGKQVKDVSFPTLETLTLEDLASFEGLLMPPNSSNDLNHHNILIFPCLSRLIIEKCPRLRLSVSCPLPSLRYLQIDDIALLPLFNPNANMQILSSLEELNIKKLHSLEHFPDQMFQGLSSVRKLSISHCLNLKTLPERFKYLSSLEELKFFDCDNLEDISKTMAYAAICDGLSGLPQDIPHRLPVLQNLRYICFDTCDSLCSLPEWLCDAINLEEIHVVHCSRTKSIPKNFKCLTKLKCLAFTGCSELSRRCRKETGDDWNDIKHIPQIMETGVDWNDIKDIPQIMETVDDWNDIDHIPQIMETVDDWNGIDHISQIMIQVPDFMR